MTEADSLKLLHESIKELREDLRVRDENIERRLGRIEAHTAKTNGRVTALELWKAGREAASAATSAIFRPLPNFLTAIVSVGVTAAVTILLTHT